MTESFEATQSSAGAVLLLLLPLLIFLLLLLHGALRESGSAVAVVLASRQTASGGRRGHRDSHGGDCSRSAFEGLRASSESTGRQKKTHKPEECCAKYNERQFIGDATNPPHAASNPALMSDSEASLEFLKKWISRLLQP